MRRKLLLILPVLALTLGILGFTIAQAADCGTTPPAPTCGCTPTACGCTPGYWKNHTDNWPAGFSPTASLRLTCGLTVSGTMLDLNGDGIDDTLLDGLNYKGGPGDDGAERILLRAAVAAALNGNATDCYPLKCDCLRTQVHDAIEEGRAAMLELASKLDGYNNAGCPFD